MLPTALILIQAASLPPGTVLFYSNYSTCAPGSGVGETCFHGTIPVTMCRYANDNCTDIPQRVASELVVDTGACRNYTWTWTCAQEWRFCAPNGQVCVCPEHNVSTCVCNGTSYNGTIVCTPSPTQVPTLPPTHVPTLAPSAVPTLPPTTTAPTAWPTFAPTNVPSSLAPSAAPTSVPTPLARAPTIAVTDDDDDDNKSMLAIIGYTLLGLVFCVIIGVCCMSQWNRPRGSDNRVFPNPTYESSRPSTASV